MADDVQPAKPAESGLDVRNNTEAHRFELEVNGHVAKVFYILEPGVITYTHTDVPSALAGRGVGSKLAKYVLDYARSQGLKVEATCPFIAAYMARHPEYNDLRI